VQHYVQQHARETPEKIALQGGSDALTYAELDSVSNQIAHCLRGAGVARRGRVIVSMARSPRSVCAMLGILKADAAYVPLSPSQPAPRSRRILQDCEPSAVLCDAAGVRSLAPLAREVTPSARIIVLGEHDLGAYTREAPPSANIDHDLAYILYTSGSTGQPKGVMISHANIRHYIEWAADFLAIRADDEILSTAPFEFDMSTFDIYAAQKAGATLHIIPDELVIFPAAVLDFMEERAITLWKGASSLLSHLEKLGTLEPHRVPRLRSVLFGGDRLPTRTLMKWMEVFPEKRFYNAYGPTEATGVSGCCFIATRPTDPRGHIPIGTPRTNSEFLLLDEDGRVVPQGGEGELCIRGAGVSAGYWRDEEKTRRAFFADAETGARVHRTGDLAFQSSDGRYHLVGRKDDQVKLRGYRVTLGEIAAELSSLDEVKDVAVLLTAAEQEPEVVVFVELAQSVSVADVVKLLKGRLPHYMQPKHVVQVESIARNERGKPDRAALLGLFADRSQATR
jgi:amino acid adenylation domain-containing protein